MGLFSTGLDRATGVRLSRLEHKLDLVLEHLGVQVPEDGLDEVRRLVEAGQKIQAIKAYRAITGAGLAEAKDAVEQGV